MACYLFLYKAVICPIKVRLYRAYFTQDKASRVFVDAFFGETDLTNLTAHKSYKVTLLSLLAISAMALSSCQADTTPTNTAKVDDRGRNVQTNNVNKTSFPSVLDYFACKPANPAFVAAHRGTQSFSEYPENSVVSLQALIDHGVDFAEIDVARLKDGTQILFHDGVWDKRATGPKAVMAKPVAATTWPESQKLLLKDTNGNISAYRPSKFTDILATAKDKIYLEIDFKASSSEANVIKTIRDADMLDQVILISYTIPQAKRLHALAPDAALSVGIFKPSDISELESAGIPTNIMTAWTGKGPLTAPLAKALRAKHIPILAASFFKIDGDVKKTGDDSLYIQFAKRPDLIVSDSAFDAKQVLEITGKDAIILQSCLAKRAKK